MKYILKLHYTDGRIDEFEWGSLPNKVNIPDYACASTDYMEPKSEKDSMPTADKMYSVKFELSGRIKKGFWFWKEEIGIYEQI